LLKKSPNGEAATIFCSLPASKNRLLWMDTNYRNVYNGGILNPNQADAMISPDGHFKIPHPWPGQNPPATDFQNVI
jgi:hypothetical protein